MIVYRNGVPLTVCDECMRPRLTGEPEWDTEPSFAAAPAQEAPQGKDRTARQVVQPAQDAHYCPACRSRQADRVPSEP
jgi:hypothetical protein